MAKKQTVKKNTLKARLHKRAKLAVVPHAANQHRPHLIRRYGIAMILVGILLAQGIYNGFVTGNVLGTQANLTAVQLLESTNTARGNEGLGALELDERLNKAAAMKAEDMLNKQYWAHDAPDGTSPWYWFERSEYQYAEAGENLAKNFTTSSGVLTAWMASPAHRANLLKESYGDVGFAVRSGQLQGEEVTLVVALYGTSQDKAVANVLNTHTAAPIIGNPLSPMAQLGLALRSLTPVSIASLVILLIAANVALIAHTYRNKLPANLRKTWYRHHGMYKALLFVVVAAGLIAAYSTTGQI